MPRAAGGRGATSTVGASVSFAPLGQQAPGVAQPLERAAAVVAEEDVLRLVGVDVRDAAAVQLGEELLQFAEEAVGDGAVLLERAAGHELVDETGGADGAEDLRYVGQVGELVVEAHLAP